MRRMALRAAVVCVVALGVVGPGAIPARADGSRAVVIVDTGSGTYTRVISFSGTVSGYRALELAGASPETYGYAGQGAAICRLFGVGNDPSGSSCLGTPDDPRYWAYFRAPAGSTGWRYSNAGAGATSVGDGDVEGWRFGTGSAPAFRAFCDVAGCAPPPAPPAPPSPPAPVAGASAATGDSPVTPGSLAAAPPPAGGTAPGPDEAGGITTSSSTPPTVPAGSAAAIGRARAAEPRALDGPRVGGDDPGSGSPLGVLVALGLVAAIAAATVVLRRRARRAG